MGDALNDNEGRALAEVVERRPELVETIGEPVHRIWCRACDGVPVVLDFPTQEARGRWASEHSRYTGHRDQWLVWTMTTTGVGDHRGQAIFDLAEARALAEHWRAECAQQFASPDDFPAMHPLPWEEASDG